MEACPDCNNTENQPVGPDLTKCLICGASWETGKHTVQPKFLVTDDRDDIARIAARHGVPEADIQNAVFNAINPHYATPTGPVRYPQGRPDFTA